MDGQQGCTVWVHWSADDVVNLQLLGQRIAILSKSLVILMEPLLPKCKNFIYLGALYDDYKPLLWLDDSHVTPVGNELIAQKMLEVLNTRGVF